MANSSRKINLCLEVSEDIPSEDQVDWKYDGLNLSWPVLMIDCTKMDCTNDGLFPMMACTYDGLYLWWTVITMTCTCDGLY